MPIQHSSLDALFIDIANVVKHSVGRTDEGVVADALPTKILNMPSNGYDIKVKKYIERTLSITPYSLAGLTSIGRTAFYNYRNLALTSLPEGITSIGSEAFHTSNLALTSLPEGLTTIGSSAFQNCTNLALTSLPEGITSINSFVFFNCTNLALTSLPEGITSIGHYAFGSCTNLKSLTFKGTPTTISSSAFEYCNNLTTINVPWSEGAVSNAPWGATNATINYNYVEV